MESAIEVMQKIESAAKLRAKPDPVRYGSLAIGDKHWQGDVCIQRIAKVSGKKIAKPSLQLAPGDTQGSRHCLDSLDGITLYTKAGTALDGPMLHATREFTVTHPEHGFCSFGAGDYAITYQRSYTKDLEEMKRVAD